MGFNLRLLADILLVTNQGQVVHDLVEESCGALDLVMLSFERGQKVHDRHSYLEALKQI